MTVKISYFKDLTGDPEIIYAESVGAWLVQLYGGGELPSDLRIFRDHLSAESDVTSDLAALLETDGEFEACHMPGWIVAAIIVLILIVAMVVLLQQKKPNIPINVNRQQASTTNSLNGRTNQARVNQRVVDVRGKVTGHIPDQLMLPYTKFVNNIENEWSFLCISAGEVTVSDVKDGDTLLLTTSGSGAAIYGPYTSPNNGSPRFTIGKPPVGPVYNVTRANEIDGITLNPADQSSLANVTFTVNPNRTVTANPAGTNFDFTTWLTPNASVALSAIFLTDVGAKWINKPPATAVTGYTQYSLSGTYLVASVDSATQITLNPLSPGTPTWPVSGGAWVGGRIATATDYVVDLYDNVGLTGSPILGVANQADVAHPLGNMNNPTLDITALTGASMFEIIASVPENTEKVWLNIVAANGLYKENNDGVYPFSITFQITFYSTIGNIFTGLKSVSNFTINGSSRDSVGGTYEVNVPYDECNIGVRRITPRDTAFAGSVIDECKWRDFYRVKDVPQDDFGPITTIHTLRQATSAALTGREAKLNVTAIRDDQQMWADVIAGMAFDPVFGRLEPSQIDLDNLYAVQEQIVAYFGTTDAVRVGYAFDSTNTSFEEAVSLMCDPVNVTPYRMGGVMKFTFERAQNQSMMQFTHRSKWPNTDERTRTFRPEKQYDGIELTYRDESTTSNLVITLPEDNVPLNPKRIELFGCITRFGAVVRARREYNKIIYARVVHQFESFGIARTCLPGHRVDVTDGTRGPFIDGEILDQQGLVVRLSQPTKFEPGMPHSIVVTNRTGGIEGIPVTQYQNDEYRVVLGRAPAEPLFVGHMEEKTQYNFGSDDTISAQAMLIQTVEPTISDGEEHIVVKAMNYDPRYYSGDTEPVT